MTLSSEQLTQFQRDGYLVIPSYLDASTVTSLRDRVHTMLNDFDLSDHPMTQFTTSDEQHIGDQYFLESHDKIRFFFDTGAFTGAALNRPKHQAINKIGHALHRLSPPFEAITITPDIAAIARSIGLQDARVLQSMIICKQPEIGGSVPPHQDSVFLYTDPPSAIGFWIALEDCTTENGCLSFIPGSHHTQKITKRFVRKDGGTTFERLSEEETCDGEFKIEAVKSGSLVLIHGNVVHKSEANTSPNSRIIYTFHVIDGTAKYDEKNWLQPPDNGEGFTKLYHDV